MVELKRTPLYNVHKELEAKLVEFGGWEMPVQYQGIIKEHQAVRQAAGLFDVSHMGELLVAGQHALNFLQQMVTNDLSKIGIGKAMYTPLIKDDGGIIDDLLIYNLGLYRYLLVVNAANKDKDLAWLNDHLEGDVGISDKSDEYALLALQGPVAQQVLQKLTVMQLDTIASFQFAIGAVSGVPCIISRTGYTGEDGFELYCHPEEIEKLWRAILEAGQQYGVVPCGLGARDTLRLEAALPLYGHELTEEIDPITAGLSWTVKFNKGEFIGREPLLKIKEAGPSYKLVGLKMIERGIARSDYPIIVNGKKVGWVTSGSFSPTKNANIALAYIEPQYAVLDTVLEIEIRGKGVKAQVIKKPFYKQKS